MEVSAKTDKGLVRITNQDFYFASGTSVGPLPNLFLVADGMGGHNAGDFASRFTTETLIDHISGAEGRADGQILTEAIAETNRELIAAAGRDPELAGTGTTLVCAFVSDGMLTAANVGDSRLYLVGESIRQITKDHSYVERMVELGRMVPGSEEYERQKHFITRAIGTYKARPDLFEVPLSEGDRILLCSDGLTNMVTDEEILRIFREEESMRAVTDRLVKLANEYGSRDNVTVVAVRP